MIIEVLSALVLIAIGCPRAAGFLQDSSTERAIAEQRGPVRIELSGPLTKTYVWAASEWTLKFENRGADGLPIGPYLLGQSGFPFGGAHVAFEVAKNGETARIVTSNSYLGQPPHVRKADLLGTGNSAELPVVLHGDMEQDMDAQREKVSLRFEPVFDTPGSYTVTAVLLWNASAIRSNPAKIEVADAPSGSKAALEGLKELAKAGICIDVQGMHTTWPPADIERIAEFVEREKYTLYGAQQQVGLAQALFSTVQARSASNASQPVPAEVTTTLERVKSLLAHEPPSDIGLERTFKYLRASIAAEDRRATERSKTR